MKDMTKAWRLIGPPHPKGYTTNPDPSILTIRRTLSAAASCDVSGRRGSDSGCCPPARWGLRLSPLPLAGLRSSGSARPGLRKPGYRASPLLCTSTPARSFGGLSGWIIRGPPAHTYRLAGSDGHLPEAYPFFDISAHGVLFLSHMTLNLFRAEVLKCTLAGCL